MTIGEYIQQINALTPAEIATAAIDENGEEIVSYTERSWVSGINPDGQSLSNATWEGSEVSSAYREKWNIYNGTYNYRFINISGDTRRGLQVRGGRIFSTTDYWGSILRNFNNAGFSPVSFARVPLSIPAKRDTASAFFRLLRARIARP
ncbi:MAG: hypothetical protein II276_05020 [Bacteroidales bacterium]|nr:hypothetical protein [Bacteroidales bacterium]